jgi:hypothetical protein
VLLEALAKNLRLTNIGAGSVCERIATGQNANTSLVEFVARQQFI